MRDCGMPRKRDNSTLCAREQASNYKNNLGANSIGGLDDRGLPRFQWLLKFRMVERGRVYFSAVEQKRWRAG